MGCDSSENENCDGESGSVAQDSVIDSRRQADMALSPLPLYYDPTLFGLFKAHTNTAEYVRHVALVWLYIGLGGLLFRTVQLFFIKDVQTGLVWMTKILTDPFHDIKLYYDAPLHLLRGELIDSMPREQHHG